jgi:hypothetical protein
MKEIIAIWSFVAWNLTLASIQMVVKSGMQSELLACMLHGCSRSGYAEHARITGMV